MMQAIRYNIETEDGRLYECRLELLPVGFFRDDYQVFISTPPNEQGVHTFYAERMIERDRVWIFEDRYLPAEIRDLERYISPFIIEMRQ